MNKYPPVLDLKRYELYEYPLRVQMAYNIYNFFFIPSYEVFLYFTEKMLKEKGKLWGKIMCIWHKLACKMFLPFLSCLLDVIFIVPRKYW